jgi:hypothetical protein
MLNQLINVLNWKQKTKLFGFMRNVHAESTYGNLAYVETDLFRDYETMLARAELEKAKALAFQFIRMAI